MKHPPVFTKPIAKIRKEYQGDNPDDHATPVILGFWLLVVFVIGLFVAFWLNK